MSLEPGEDERKDDGDRDCIWATRDELEAKINKGEVVWRLRFDERPTSLLHEMWLNCAKPECGETTQLTTGCCVPRSELVYHTTP